uniref:Parathyroid hormone n=1 Tax=Neolamprologus brichardi TaxID=32507 RepID=A0A3Q4H5B4_NEOBR
MHWKSDININSENGSLMTRGGTISEVQLMHNVREHKQVGERQDWLQEKLKGIIVASSKPLHGKVAGEREVWASLLRLLPPRPGPG